MKIGKEELVEFVKWGNKTLKIAHEEFVEDEAWITYWSDTIGNTNYVFMLCWEDGYDAPNDVQLNLSIRVKDTDLFADAWDFMCDGETVTVGITIDETAFTYLLDFIVDGGDILELTKFKYTTVTNQTANMFSPNHVKYRCTINYKGETFGCNFQCPSQEKPTKEDFLGCLISDAMYFDNCKNIFDFCDELGYDCYEDKKESERIYKGCQRESEGLHKLYTEEELNLLSEYLQERGY